MTRIKSKQNIGRQKIHRVMTCQEVAEQMGNISAAGVLKLEQSALRKLRRSPTLFLAFLNSVDRENWRRSTEVGTLSKSELRTIAYGMVHNETKQKEVTI